MQLILRQPASRTIDDDATEVVVAASPDTFGREPWQWDVRVATVDEGYRVTAAHNPANIKILEEDLDIHDSYQAIRGVDELWLAVIMKHSVTHGVFTLHAGDVAIWEGDDPVRIRLDAVDGDACVRLIRIARRDGKAARWVP